MFDNQTFHNKKLACLDSREYYSDMHEVIIRLIYHLFKLRNISAVHEAFSTSTDVKQTISWNYVRTCNVVDWTLCVTSNQIYHSNSSFCSRNCAFGIVPRLQKRTMIPALDKLWSYFFRSRKTKSRITTAQIPYFFRSRKTKSRITTAQIPYFFRSRKTKSRITTAQIPYFFRSRKTKSRITTAYYYIGVFLSHKKMLLVR